MQPGDPCWRDATGAAVLELPWRVYLPDGTPRTDPAQWSEDADVLAATGWQRSTLTDADVAALTPTPEPCPPTWQTPWGWSLPLSPAALQSLTSAAILASWRPQPATVSVIDAAGERRSVALSEWRPVLLAFSDAVEATYGSS